MGDLNGVVDPKVDKRNESRQKEGKLPTSFSELTKQENLEDIWRKFNPGVKDSTIRGDMKCSRIDMIWLSKEQTRLTKKVEIMPRVNSDHNPMLWKGTSGNRKKRWRMNEELLNKKENVEHLHRETKHYIQANVDNEVEIRKVWDAYKAVMGGNLISLNSKEKKRKKKIKN